MFEVAGQPIPATIHLLFGYRTEVVEGDLQFGPLHQFVQRVRVRETDNGVLVSDSVVRVEGRFDRIGDTIKVVYTRPGNGSDPFAGRTYQLLVGGMELSGFEALVGADIGVFTYTRR